MDKDERLKVQAQAVEVRLTTREQKAAIKMSDLSFNDMKVLCLLHNPEMPKTIESVLNRYSGNIKDKSMWVKKLIQGSRVASDITKHNIDGYNTFIIDASNIELMQDWAQKQQASKPAGEKKVTTFRDIIQYQDKEKLLERLHCLIDGKGGKDVGVVLVRAKYIDHYLTRYPYKKEFESEFKFVGSWSGISNYFYKESDNGVSASASSIVILK